MNCARVRRKIEEHAGSTGGACDELERHAARCPSCARELAAARRLGAVLAALPAREPDPDFDARLAAALAAATPRPAPAALWERLRFELSGRLRAPAWAAAGVLAAGVAGAVVLPQAERQEVRREYVASAVARHRQIEQTSTVDWDAVDASIRLNTGELLPE